MFTMTTHSTDFRYTARTLAAMNARLVEECAAVGIDLATFEGREQAYDYKSVIDHIAERIIFETDEDAE